MLNTRFDLDLSNVNVSVGAIDQNTHIMLKINKDCNKIEKILKK